MKNCAETVRPVRAAKKVAVCVSLVHAAERDFLSGVFLHLDQGFAWKLQLLQDSPPFTAQSLAQAAADGLDGIIISDAHPQDMIPELVTTPIPLAVISGDAFRDNHPLIRRVRPAVAIHNDNHAISELAVRHLLTCGRFNSFGFVPAGAGVVWSDERRNAFVSLLAAKGFDTRVYDRASDNSLTDWLTALPKPAAVMVAYDELASDVLSACEAAGIAVPRQVSVIGVDNDKFVCRHAVPPLSSVLPGHEDMGYRAAVELERLMSGRCKWNGKVAHIVIPPRKVVIRESTQLISPTAGLIERLKAQILAEATNGAKVADIVRKVGVSRRLAELRFREVEGQTLAEALAHRRLEEAARLIRTSKRTFRQIAADCGFSDAKHLTHRFTEAFGVPPRDFRNRRPCRLRSQGHLDRHGFLPPTSSRRPASPRS